MYIHQVVALFASEDEHLDSFESAQYMSDFKMQVELDLNKTSITTHMKFKQ